MGKRLTGEGICRMLFSYPLPFPLFPFSPIPLFPYFLFPYLERNRDAIMFRLNRQLLAGAELNVAF